MQKCSLKKVMLSVGAFLFATSLSLGVGMMKTPVQADSLGIENDFSGLDTGLSTGGIDSVTVGSVADNYLVINKGIGGGKTLKREKVQFEGCTEVYKLVETLPSIETIEKMLEKIGCPTRFSQIGVREETFVDMIYNAYTVRDRYTVLTLIKEIGLSDKILPIVKKYY